MIEVYTRETIQEEINKLREQGFNIWSISRLNSFNNCKRAYYYTYVNKKPQKDGSYSMLGSAMHNDFEDLYTGKTEHLVPKNFSETWFQTEVFDIKFPSENIKENYKKDLDKMYQIYKKMDGEFISELGFVFKIDDKNAILGYIDLVKIIDDKTIEIYDFKSSAYFKGDKLLSAGRQLCVYQKAIEQLYGYNVVKNAWIMAKYCDIKIGDNKPIIAVQNKDIVKKSEIKLKKLMKNMGYDDVLIDIFIANCYKNSSFDELPKEVLSKIQIDTHIKYYDITESIEEESMKYIKDTINAILDTNPNDIDAWQCNHSEFFCSNLCGFNDTYCFTKLCK